MPERPKAGSALRRTIVSPRPVLAPIRGEHAQRLSKNDKDDVVVPQRELRPQKARQLLFADRNKGAN